MADRTASSIMIGVPRPEVMAVIADFAAYPQWASGVRRADILSRGSDGRAATVRFTLDAGIIKDSYVLAYTWDDDAEVRWDLAEGGSMLTEMAGGYQLADRDGGTEVAYQLAVGTRVPMIGMIRRKAEKAIIDAALKGLKSRAETIGRAR
jgi:ribosome-associated toxin RatA of RatAB toxin-antitoxin module